MRRLPLLMGSLSLAFLYACEPAPSLLQVDPSFAKSGGGPIKVDATDPTEAPQDTTLTIRILGSGFEAGASAAFLLNGAPTPGVVTNRTRFVSETELEADVTIALDAEVALYDVEVASKGRRRRGVGTELFSVVQKQNGPESGPAETAFADDAGHRIFSDGEGAYLPVRKQQRVETEVTTAGQHWLRLNERSGRALCVAFPDAASDAEIYSASDWTDFVARSGGSTELGQTFCSLVTMHTRDHSHPDNLAGMDLDPTTPDRLNVQTSGGVINLMELDPNDSWEWRLLFDDKHTSVNGGDRRNGVCIRYNGDGSWTLGNDPSLDDFTEDDSACDGMDDWVNLIRVTLGGTNEPATYTHVARFRMPFRYTVTPLF